MAEYYLLSQLPSLDGITEDKDLPITEERFFELCNLLLSEKSKCELQNLSLLPSQKIEETNSPLICAWNEGERNLRLALGKVRADKMKKPFDTENKSLSAELIKTATTAIEMDNPLKAEKFLNLYRLEFLETLRPLNTFSEEFVYYYGLKLKLILYIKQFDAETGKAAYRNIYNSILNGDRQEAI